ncbi:MAG: DUF2500 domain-containing protein, partial [Propionibacteriaceae bacterium]|nr:DUF2500 domain-containing protein [Propionibacteriaceae bacterium]
MIRLIFIAFIVVFLVILGVIIWTLATAISQRVRSGSAPVLTVRARVVAKRLAVVGANVANTFYYTTFEVDSGSRMELRVDPPTYGQLAEGDVGGLTFQGT